MAGAQGFIAEQQRDQLEAALGGALELLERLERRTQRCPRILVGRALGEPRGDQFALLGQAVEREVFLVAEVVEQGPLGDARRGRDLLECRVVVPLGREQFEGGPGDQRANHRAGLLTKRCWFLSHAPMVHLFA
jgi:hypothetical protein